MLLPASIRELNAALPLGFAHNSTSLFLSCLAFFILFILARTALSYKRALSQCKITEKPIIIEAQEKAEDSPSRWYLGVATKWQWLSRSLPLSLTAVESKHGAESVGRGVGVGLKTASKSPSSSPAMSEIQKKTHRGPTFDRPVAAIYQSEMPASMAKIILARHTFRKPSPGTRKPSTPSSRLPQEHEYFMQLVSETTSDGLSQPQAVVMTGAQQQAALRQYPWDTL